MDGIIGSIDWDGCDDCQNWDGDVCHAELIDDDLRSSIEDQTVKCLKYLSSV